VKAGNTCLGLPLDVLTDSIRRNVQRARWWPKGSTAISVDIVCSDRLAAVAAKASNGIIVFFLLTRSSGPPIAGESFTLNIGDFNIVEAEVTEEFPRLVNSAGIVEVELLKKLNLNDLATKKTVGMGSSNVLVLLEDGVKAVYKGYRYLDRHRREVRFLKYLSSKGYRNAPELYGVVRYRGYEIGIIVEYVENVGDGGLPFYIAAVKEFEGSMHRSDTLDLAESVGRTVGEFHRVIASSNDPWFSSEPLDKPDIDSIVNRMKFYAEHIKKTLNQAEYAEIDLIEGLLEERVNSGILMLEKYEGLNKLRTHQDLHLAQFIYSPTRGFVFSDFEGEPIRMSILGDSKEPPLRDVASLLRSLDYIAVFAYAEASKQTPDNVAKKALTDRSLAYKLLEWRNKYSSKLVAGYFDALQGECVDVIGAPCSHAINHIAELLYPLMLERALYEAVYESAFNPNLVWIPLLFLVFEPLSATPTISL